MVDRVVRGEELSKIHNLESGSCGHRIRDTEPGARGGCDPGWPMIALAKDAAKALPANLGTYRLPRDHNPVRQPLF
jgi:hypothetical protein